MYKNHTILRNKIFKSINRFYFSNKIDKFYKYYLYISKPIYLKKWQRLNNVDYNSKVAWKSYTIKEMLEKKNRMIWTTIIISLCYKLSLCDFRMTYWNMFKLDGWDANFQVLQASIQTKLLKWVH